LTLLLPLSLLLLLLLLLVMLLLQLRLLLLLLCELFYLTFTILFMPFAFLCVPECVHTYM